MPTSSNEQPSYPSRRSLRKAREAQLQAAPHAPEPASGRQDASSTAPQTTGSFAPTSFVVGSVPAPLPEASKQLSDPPRKLRKKPRFRKFLAAGFAGASVTGLSLTFALPLFATTSESFGQLPLSAQNEQRLFSGTSVAQPDTMDAIGAVTLSIDPTSGMPVLNEPGLFDSALIDNTKLRMPFEQDWPLTDGFAYRTAPVEQFHDAQDIAAPAGTPVLAIGSGKVVEAGYATDGCGFSIKIQHVVDGATLTSRYCHMQEDSHSYEVGDDVSAGVQVGRVGNTGLSFGPHLHLALRLNGAPIDPLPYIESKTGE